jgi:catechol 2,3-dioxygenase-like lactoylglutathione lyase family enzyme
VNLSAVTLLVHDVDQALVFFTRSLGFVVVKDVQITGIKRRVVVSPQVSGCVGILLAHASSEPERALVGQQAAGKVFMFLTVDDVQACYGQYLAAGVHFVEPPITKPHGAVAVFLDVAGNRWDLIQTHSVSVLKSNG